MSPREKQRDLRQVKWIRPTLPLERGYEKEKMMKKIWCLIFVLVLMFSQTIYAQEKPSNHKSVIHTEGAAEISGQNDSAKISVSIITEGKRLDDASVENANKTKAVLAAVKQLNIKNINLNTSNYRVNPKRDYKARPPKIVGYEVQNAIDIKMEKFDPKQLSEYSSKIIGTALDNGANNISYIQSYIKDMEALENQALAAAIKKAKARADVIARAAGVKIVKIVSISTQPDNAQPMPRMARSTAMMAEANTAAPAIEIGESNIRVHVNMSVEIE